MTTIETRVTDDPRYAHTRDGLLKHTDDCKTGGRFAKYDAEHCARCEELENGAPARTHAGIEAMNRARRSDMHRNAGIRAHFASAEHRSGGCGPVCTFGDW